MTRTKITAWSLMMLCGWSQECQHDVNLREYALMKQFGQR